MMFILAYKGTHFAYRDRSEGAMDFRRFSPSACAGKRSNTFPFWSPKPTSRARRHRLRAACRSLQKAGDSLDFSAQGVVVRSFDLSLAHRIMKRPNIEADAAVSVEIMRVRAEIVRTLFRR
jgi:hypothetical protein